MSSDNIRRVKWKTVGFEKKPHHRCIVIALFSALNIYKESDGKEEIRNDVNYLITGTSFSCETSI